MWALFRDWLVVNTVLHGPEDTRRKVRAVRTAAGQTPGLLAGTLRLAFWVTWWGSVLLCAAVGIAGTVQGQPGLLVGAGFLIAILVALRAAWRWFRQQVAAADDAAARAKARRGWPRPGEVQPY